MRATAVLVTLETGERAEFADVDVEHDGSRLCISYSGAELASYDRRELTSWSLLPAADVGTH